MRYTSNRVTGRTNRIEAFLVGTLPSQQDPERRQSGLSGRIGDRETHPQNRCQRSREETIGPG
jgi:hypothetical protein